MTSTVLTLDRSGKENALPLPPGYYMLARFSPDGGRIALTRFSGIRGSIVMYERERHIVSTLTPEPGTHFVPVWSPDGRRIAFSRFAERNPALSVKNADGSGEIEPLTEPSEDAQFPELVVSGRQDHPVYAGIHRRPRPQAEARLDGPLARHPGDPASARLFFESPFRETGGAFSPDGRWIAYVSDESGVREVYVRPYPGPGASVKVSNGFAIEPLWSRRRPGAVLPRRRESGEVHGRRDPDRRPGFRSRRPGFSSLPSSPSGGAKTDTASTTSPPTGRSSCRCATAGPRSRSGGSRS